VTVKDGGVTRFATFMTGELFEAISKQTILSHAVAEAEAFTGDHEAFTAAVRDIYAHPELPTNRLFTLRSGQLLHGLAATDAKARLSGIMIGLEIAGAHSQAKRETPVVLIGSGALGALYEGAFTALDIHYTVIDADDAVRRGLLAAANAIWP
jgi:2-dehydro-3-deoxygalactonokinase